MKQNYKSIKYQGIKPGKQRKNKDQIQHKKYNQLLRELKNKNSIMKMINKANKNQKNKDKIWYQYQIKPNDKGWSWRKKIKKITNKTNRNQKNEDQDEYKKKVADTVEFCRGKEREMEREEKIYTRA